MSNRLEARVTAKNRANSLAAQYSLALTASLTPLVGQKIVKKDKSLTKKVQTLIPTFPTEPGVTCYLYRESPYNVTYVIKVCEQVENSYGCVYEEAWTTVAQLNPQTGELVKVEEPETFRSDYSVTEILKLREDYEQKKKAMEEAKSRLNPFGDTDR